MNNARIPVAPSAALAVLAASSILFLASCTPIPTLADQAREFGDPIMAAIAGTQPTYFDDFTDPASGWGTGSLADGTTWGYSNGEYVVAAPAGAGSGAGSPSIPPLVDMVIELDARFLQGGQDSVWYVHIRNADTGDYNVSLHPTGNVTVSSSTGPGGQGFAVVAEQSALSFITGTTGQTNHFTLIAKGPTMVVYINGEPLFLIDDLIVRQGGLNPGIGAGSSATSVAFDNVRIWDAAQF